MENLFTYAVDHGEIKHDAIDQNTDCKDYCYPDIRTPAGWMRKRFWLCSCGAEFTDKDLIDMGDDMILHHKLQTTGGYDD